MQDRIRVFVIDPQPMARHGWAAMLADDARMLWVGEAAADDAQALQAATLARADVIVVALQAPQAVDGLAALRSQLPQARLVLVVNRFDAADARRAGEAAAAHWLLRRSSAAEFLATVRAAHEGQPLGAAPAPPPRPDADVLTQREHQLLLLMARGLTNLDISRQLAIAMPTVKFHVTNILAKLRAGNRTEAVLVALRQGLVTLE